MRRALVLVLALVPLAATACGGGGALSLDPVAKAAEKTATVQSAHFSMQMNETIGGVGPLKVIADGVSVPGTKSADVQIDMSSFASMLGAKAGSPSDWRGEEILDGSNGGLVLYMRLPFLQKTLHAEKPWVSIDLQSAGSALGVNFSQLLQQAGNTDPTQSLRILKEAGNVHEAGRDQVGGVETTRYTGTIDLQKALQKLGAGSAGFGRVLREEGVKMVPVEVWVGDDNLVRRFHETFTLHVPKGPPVGIDMTDDLSDFNAPATVQPPPADQVVDISKLIRKGG